MVIRRPSSTVRRSISSTPIPGWWPMTFGGMMMRMIMLLDRVKCVPDSWCTNFGFHRIITVTLIMQTHTHTHNLSSNCCLPHNSVHVVIRSNCTGQAPREVYACLPTYRTTPTYCGMYLLLLPGLVLLLLLDEKSIKRAQIYPSPDSYHLLICSPTTPQLPRHPGQLLPWRISALVDILN